MRSIPYQYKSDDNVVGVSEQFGVTPQQLLNANPGGAPFNTGQTINVPQTSDWENAITWQDVARGFRYAGQYLTAGNPNASQVTQRPVIPFGYNANNAAQAPAYQRPAQQPAPPSPYGGVGWGALALQPQITQNVAVPPTVQNLIQQGVPTSVASQITAPQTVQPGYTDFAQRPAGAEAGFWNLVSRIQDNPAEYDNLTQTQRDVIDRRLAQENGGPTLGKGDFYGYEYNKETGKSERVVMNAANGDSFTDQLRWDPSSGKYVKIGDLLKQGKLDLQGNTYGGYRRGRGGGGGGYRPAQPKVMKSYGVINFGIAAG